MNIDLRSRLLKEKEAVRLRVQKFREKQKLKPSYSHEKQKEKERMRIATYRMHQTKCPLKWKCVDISCKLHPDRDRKRKAEEVKEGSSSEGFVDGRILNNKKRGVKSRLEKNRLLISYSEYLVVFQDV